MCRRVHELLAPLLCLCVYCLRLLSETEALLASRVSNDTSNERFIFIDESESIRTHADSQFVKAYTNFKTSKYPEIFIPIAIACLFFGALGNIGFFALFGNKLKRAYYTRDSLYFRFLATLDILVCIIVLPYAMFFEAERVTNNYVCKSMEYVRHFLTYMAHLGLLSYSFELPLRQGYTASKNHVRRAAYGIVILSAFCSIPVIFLFEINPIAFNNTLTPVLHKRHAVFEHAEVKTVYDTSKLKSCHMTFNFQPNWKYHDLLEYAKKMYYGINTLLYSAGLLLYVYKVILFIDARPLLGQDSLFIQNVIDVREHSFSMTSPELASKPDKRKQSTTNPVYLKNQTDDEMTDVTEDAASTKSADAKAKTSSKDADPSNEGVRKVESDSSTRSQNNNLDRPEAGRERKVSFGDAMIDSVSYNPDDTVRSIQKSEWNQPSRPILKSNERSSLPPILYVKVHSDVEADFTDVYKSLEPRYCHMTLNLNTTWEYYDLMKYAEKMYYAINTLLYSAGLLLYVYKVILFIDARPLLGQDSIFIQTVIDVREGSFILPEDMAKQDKKRQSTTNPVYLRGKPTEEDLDDIDAPIHKQDEENKSSNNHASDVDTKKESSRPVENLDKDFENYEENKSSNNHASDVDTKKESSRPVENLNKDFEKYEENKSSNNDASELDSKKKYRHPDQNQNSTSDVSQDRKVSFGDSMVNSITYSADESTKTLLRSDSKPKAPRPILKSQEKPSLKISSYKKSMMLLIFLDLLIITLTVIIDLAVKSSTTVLNFIHLKSVISFYLISLTNRDLRNATWGRYISCCNKIPSTSKRRMGSTAEQEFFGSNVRPELMKAWGRESYEGSDVTETSNVSGVSDIPTPVLLQDRSYGSSVSAKSSVIRT